VLGFFICTNVLSVQLLNESLNTAGETSLSPVRCSLDEAVIELFTAEDDLHFEVIFLRLVVKLVFVWGSINVRSSH